MELSRKGFLAALAAQAAGAAFGGDAKPASRLSLSVTPGGREFAGMNGAFAALYTPYAPDGRINLEMIDRIVEYGLSRGLKGFYVTGSTGESMYLSVEERAAVIARAVKAVNGRGKVIAHVGYASTDDSIRCAKLAADAGADWVSSVAPGFLAFGADAVFNHYRLVAQATDRPFLVYSWKQDVDPDRDAKLFDIPNVKGMKYTASDFYSVQRLKRRIGKEAVFYVGNDPMLLPGLAYGNVFNGGIGLYYNFMPKHFAQVCACVAAGRFDEAAVWQDEINRVMDATSTTDYSVRKAIMKYIGLDCGPCRHPFEALSPERYDKLCATLDALGIIRRNDALS